MLIEGYGSWVRGACLQSTPHRDCITYAIHLRLKTSAVRPQIEEVREELGKRGLDPEEAPMAARLQLVEDMEGDSERDAVRDAEQFVDQVGARHHGTVLCPVCATACWS